MNKPIQYQTSYLFSDIMCFDGCGTYINHSITSCFAECKNELPTDATLVIDAEPHNLGVHRLLLSIKSTEKLPTTFHTKFDKKIKEHVSFPVLDEPNKTTQKSPKTNIYNIAINLCSTALIVFLLLTAPSSVLLTASLTLISLLTTAFTAREYLFSFFSNIYARKPFNMNSTITLGWLLSCAHTLFHALMMPMGGSFSMMFMNFIMPSILILCINSMDEIKRRLLGKAAQKQLQGIQNLFPEMANHYQCYILSEEQLFSIKNQSLSHNDKAMAQILKKIDATHEQKNGLQEGMLIAINQGTCIPVDCILVQEEALVDDSLLTGEPQQHKKWGEKIPAGAINIGPKILVLACANSYNSTINRLLFRSNRASSLSTTAKPLTPLFIYFYGALIATSLLTAIAAPLLLGIITTSVIIQNIMGILFSICPCTIAIAHQLPELLHDYYLTKKGIHVRQKETLRDIDTFHTIVFDKTGTLTTNNSLVDSSDIPLESSLWQKIYLLEASYGNKHPIAKAIINHCKAIGAKKNSFTQAKDYLPDPHHRGFSAIVRGKRIHLGNAQYFADNQISIPLIPNNTTNSGLSSVYVAENNQYQGVMYIKHEVRAGMIETLQELKKSKRIIMLTGDNLASAHAFNQQIGSIFADHEIYAGQTPQQKEDFFQQESKSDKKLQGFCFIGDGLNDAPCCKLVSEQGGLSCSIENKDKSIFFTDICLNGSLDYLLQQKSLKKSLKHNIMQNQGALAYSTFISLAFIIGFSFAGISVPAIIPMFIMITTTLFVFANAHRLQGAIDSHLEKNSSWLIRFCASNDALYIPLIASSLLIFSMISATISTGALTIPFFIFNAGVLMSIASMCSHTALALTAFTTFLTAASFVSMKPKLPISSQEVLATIRISKSTKSSIYNETPSHSFLRFFSPAPTNEKKDSLTQECLETTLLNNSANIPGSI